MVEAEKINSEPGTDIDMGDARIELLKNCIGHFFDDYNCDGCCLKEHCRNRSDLLKQTDDEIHQAYMIWQKWKGDDQSAKADAGKPILTLVPPEVIYSIERVRRFGVEKYHDPDNWRRVSIERYWEATCRHILAAWNDVEHRDPESGLLSIEHAVCDLAFILQLMREKS